MIRKWEEGRMQIVLEDGMDRSLLFEGPVSKVVFLEGPLIDSVLGDDHRNLGCCIGSYDTGCMHFA